MRRFLQLFVLLLMVGFSSFVGAKEKPTVFVSILPQKFFVQQLAGTLVDVEVMVLPGASPATYEPKVSQMKKLSQTEVYFAIGAPFERAWLDRIAGVNGQMRVVRTDDGIDKRKMAAHHHEGEEHHGGHDEGAEVGEGSLDPHIWLSPELVKKQVETISVHLEKLLPESAAVIAANRERFLREIDTLNKEIEEILAAKKGARFMVFHPTWGYFAEDYHLQQVPIEVEGKGPKSSQLRVLIGIARENNIKAVFVQPQFSKKSANLIAREIGGRVVPLDPLSEDWLNNMKIVAETFRDSL